MRRHRALSARPLVRASCAARIRDAGADGLVELPGRAWGSSQWRDPNPILGKNMQMLGKVTA